jgi:hypothetical protein
MVPIILLIKYQMIYGYQSGTYASRSSIKLFGFITSVFTNEYNLSRPEKTIQVSK